MKDRSASVFASCAAAFLAAIISTGQPLDAQQGAPAPKLSLEDCLARGLAVSKANAAAAARTAGAAARLGYMERQYFPSLVGSGSYTRSSEVDSGTISVKPTGAPAPLSITLPSSLQDAWLFRLGMQQPLFTGFRVEAGIGQAKAALEAARADAKAQGRDSASTIEKAWWGLVLAQESARVVTESASSIRAHVGEAQSRLDKGIGLRSELLSARMRVADLDAMLSDVSAGLSLARARLNLLMGLAWDAPTEAQAPAAATEAVTSATLPDLNALLSRAKAARPELASAASRVASSIAAESIARSGLLPNVFLTGSLALADPNPKAFPQSAGFAPLWDIGLLVSFDLGKIPAALSQADEARSTSDQARLSLAQAGDAVTFDVVSAWLELSRAADKLKATDSSVGLAEEALRSQKDRLAAGLALGTEVSDAEAALLNARLERTRSRVAWELARAALRDATGGD